MKELEWDYLKEGMEASFSVTVTEEKLNIFCDLSGDENPLHRDDKFAKSVGFRGRIAFGFLTSAFLSQLVGCYLPGKYCIIQEINVKFPYPVYPGDTLVVHGYIKKKYEAFRRLKLNVDILNQYRQKVVYGYMNVGVLEKDE